MIKYIMVVPQSPSVSPAGHLTAGILPSVTTLNVPLLCSPALCPCRPSPCGPCRPPWPFPGAASAPTGRVRACCMARLIFSAVSEVSDFFRQWCGE